MANPFESLSDFFTPHSVIKSRTEENLRLKQSAARLPGIAKAGEFASSAGSRQEAIRRFLADPEALNSFFTEGAGTVEEFTKMFENITPKPLEQATLGPGSSVYGPDETGMGMEELASQPTAEEQSAAAQEQYIPPHILREIRRMVGLADPTQTERAVAEMIANNPDNPRIRELGIKVRAGMIKESSIRDPQSGRLIPTLIDIEKGMPISAVGEDMTSEIQTQATPVQTATMSEFEFNPAEQRTVNMPAKYSPLFETAERTNNLPAGFVARVASFESGFNSKARGAAGEIGMMQFMPATAKGLKLSNPENEQEAVPAAAWYLGKLRDKYGGNLAHAIVAYNRGEPKADAWIKDGAKVSELPQATQDYLNYVFGPKQTADLLFPEVAQRIKEKGVVADEQAQLGGRGLPMVETPDDLQATALEGAFSVGPIPSAAALWNHTVGLARPDLIQYVEEDGRRAMKTLQRYAQDYFEKSGKESNEDVKRVIDLLPTLGVMGAFETPYNAVQKMIELRGLVARGMNADAIVVNNAQNLPEKLVEGAFDSWKRGNVLLDMIGTVDELRIAKARAQKESMNPELAEKSAGLWNRLYNSEQDDDTSMRMELQELEEGGAASSMPAGTSEVAPAGAPASSADIVGMAQGTATGPASGRAMKPGPAVPLSPEQRTTNLRNELNANKISRDSGVPRPIVDFAIGFQEASVETLAIPADVVRKVFAKVGMAHLAREELQGDAETAEIMKNDFRRAGYEVDAPATLAATFGRGSFQAGILAYGLIAAAPRVAAMKGEAYITQMLQKVGTWIQKNPGKFTAMEMGGGGGAAVGEEMADRAGMTGVPKVAATIAGGVVGSAGTSLLTNIPARVGVGIAKGVERQVERFIPGQTPKPIRGPGVGASAVQDFGKAMAKTVHTKATSRKGALARFTRQDPDKAVEKIFSGKNPESEMRKIVAATRVNKEASDGLKDGVVDYLFRKTNGDVNAFDRLWSHPANKRAFTVALGKDTTARLDASLDAVKRLALGEEKSRPFRGRIGGGTSQPFLPITFLARVLGSQTMKAGGFATLQAQSAGASAAQKALMKSYESLFKNIPPEVLFREALLDPKFERMLKSRLGNGSVANKRIGRGIGAAHGVLETQTEE